MAALFIWTAVLIASLYTLAKSSDYFTESAEKIGLFLGLSPLFIGITIIAIGTSIPELATSIFSVLKNSSEIVVGNVVGSNIANILFIMGITAIIYKKLRFTYKFINIDLPLLIGSAVLLAITIWDGLFTNIEGLIFIIIMTLYINHSLNYGKKKYYRNTILLENDKKSIRIKKFRLKNLFILLISILFIYISANYTIESVIKISSILNIGKEILAIFVVALGTSLPELAVNIVAVRKNKPDIAIGNIFGSNIFNTLIVMGVPSLFGTLIIPKSILIFSLPVMLIATVLFWFLTGRGRLSLVEGVLFLAIYILFIITTLGIGTFL